MFDNAGPSIPRHAEPTEAQSFVDASLKLMQQDFKLSDAPPPVREQLEAFPLHHQLTVLKTLTAWSIRMISPAYQPLPAATFLLVVPSARRCRAETFDACSLWHEPQVTPEAEARAFFLLAQHSRRGRMPYEVMRTLAHGFVATPDMRDWFTRAIQLDQPVCLFTNEIRVGRVRGLGVVALPTLPREPMRTMLTSGARLPDYAHAIYDGEPLAFTYGRRGA